MKLTRKSIFAILLALSIGLSGCGNADNIEADTETTLGLVTEEASEISGDEEIEYIFDLGDVPDFSGEPYICLNDNYPTFMDDEMVTTPFEEYSALDEYGRCGAAYANICKEIMPTEKRGEIGEVFPSGWHTVKYNDIIDGNYLYNRCHLIGYQLAGENANELNLITGTRYLNVQGMLPFEDMVADYVEETNNHVLYRVTPVFEGTNLVAAGVIMEGKSVEDNGEGICFNVFVYNVQPGIIIDYADGESCADENYKLSDDGEITYILNSNTKKFHYPYCSSVDDIAEKNKQEFTGSREDAVNLGYEPCKRCNP